MGPSSSAKAVDQWAYAHGVALHFIEPGNPVQNATGGLLKDDVLFTVRYYTCYT